MNLQHDNRSNPAGAPDQAAMVTLPKMGSYSDMMQLTGKSYQTVTRWVCRKKLKPGVYAGCGMFNLARLNEYLQKDGRFLKADR